MDATLQPTTQPIKKKSKQNLVPSEDIDKRESQQQRILNAAYLIRNPSVYLVGDPLESSNKHVVTTYYVIHPEVFTYRPYGVIAT